MIKNSGEQASQWHLAVPLAPGGVCVGNHMTCALVGGSVHLCMWMGFFDMNFLNFFKVMHVILTE